MNKPELYIKDDIKAWKCKVCGFLCGNTNETCDCRDENGDYL